MTINDELHYEFEKLAHDLTQVILPLGVALSTEKDPNKLLERILVEARAICHADAGLLFLRTDDDTLELAVRRSVPLPGSKEDMTSKTTVSPPLRLYHPETGEPNHRNVATCTALNNHTINIPDIYASDSFDFSGTKEFDRTHQYRTTSILAMPLRNYRDEVIGVFELINAKDAKNGRVVPFDTYRQLVAESLSSLATVALNNQRLLAKQENLVAELQARMAELRTIHEVGQTISSSVELSQTLSYILASVTSVIPCDAAEISLYNELTNKMIPQLASSSDRDEARSISKRLYDTHEGYIGLVVDRKRGVLLNGLVDSAPVEDCAERSWQHLRPQSYLGVPLMAKNSAIGVIELVSCRTHGFDENNLRILESIAAQAAITVQNAQAVQERERKLKKTIQDLRIQIDEAKRQAEVEQITSSDYFQDLSAKVQDIRARSRRKK